MPKQQSKHKFSAKTITLIVTGSVLVVCIVYLLSSPPEPEPQSNWSPGQFIESFIHETDNAFYDYLIAARMFEDIHNVELDRALALEEETFAIIRRGVNKNSASVPDIVNVADVLGVLGQFRQIAKSMDSYARMKAAKGDLNGACDTYLDMMKFGWDISKNGPILTSMVSIAINALGINGLHEILANMDEQSLHRVLLGLNEVQTRTVSINETVDSELRYIKNVLEYQIRSRGNVKKLHGYESNWQANGYWLYLRFNSDRIRQDLGDLESKVHGLVDSPFHKGDEKEYDSMIADLSATLKGFATAMPTLKTQYAHVNAMIEGTKTRAALELYERRHDEYPESLHVLVDEGIIPKIPIDPFSGEAFKYSENKIYSVGQDLEDEMGRDMNYTTKKGDLVF